MCMCLRSALLLISALIAVRGIGATDTLNTNLTALACLNQVEQALFCGLPREKTDRVGILRSLDEFDRIFSRSDRCFNEAKEWMTVGLLGDDDVARRASLGVAYARLMRFAGLLYGFPDYAARGRTLHERIIAESGGEPSFRDVSMVPAQVRAYDALMVDSRRELMHAIRPGGDGRPFWNANAMLFIYPPAFDFCPVPAANAYRFTIIDDVQDEHIFTADTPCALLTPVWPCVPIGFTTVRCEALDAQGRVLACAGTRRFWRSAPFDPAEYASAKRDYATVRKKLLSYLLSWPEIDGLVRDGRPNLADRTNFTSYPSKMQSAVIGVMLEIAREIPENRERALLVARKAAEYLLSTREPPGTPLEGFTATYAGVGQCAGVYAGQHMLVYPASAGDAFLKLYAAEKDAKYLEAARQIGNTYLKLQGEDGTWYLKMDGATGEPVCPNRQLPTTVMAFFENLYQATGELRYREAADRAFASIVRGPLDDWDWEGQFEDIAPSTARYQNLSKHMACETALYMLERYPNDSAKIAMARDILRFAEDQFVMWRTPCRPDGTGLWKPGYPFFAWRAPTVLEQYRCYAPIDASAAKLIKMYLALYRAEGHPLDLAKAQALGDSMVNNQDDNGRIRTYWIPENGDDDPLAGVVHPASGHDWFNCMAADAEALSLLVRATTRK